MAVAMAFWVFGLVSVAACFCSAGIASLACAGGMTTKAALVSLADQRLYSAKQGGRNRVVGG